LLLASAYVRTWNNAVNATNILDNKAGRESQPRPAEHRQIAGARMERAGDLGVPDQRRRKTHREAIPFSWGPMTTTRIIFNRIKELGWHVTSHYVNGTVEFHAVKLDCSQSPQVARCNDGDGPDEEYRAACLLATACGMDLEDG
jgi:hypothetical protein